MCANNLTEVQPPVKLFFIIFEQILDMSKMSLLQGFARVFGAKGAEPGATQQKNPAAVKIY